MDSWNKDESILRERIADLERQQEKMMKCTTCPHEVGDATERDCAFPDCSGGWEQVHLDSQEQIADLERQLAVVTDERDLLISFMKRRDAGYNFSEWDIVCQEYPYLKELEQTE